MTVDRGRLNLRNRNMSIEFNPQTGLMSGFTNRLTGDSFQVSGDAFEIHTPDAAVLQSQTRLASVDTAHAGVLQFGYELDGVCATVTYRLAESLTERSNGGCCERGRRSGNPCTISGQRLKSRGCCRRQSALARRWSWRTTARTSRPPALRHRDW